MQSQERAHSSPRPKPGTASTSSSRSFEFLEFNDAIEADITELFELYYQDIEEKNNNPELTTCSTDSSSSDDDEPCDYDLTNEAMDGALQTL